MRHSLVTIVALTLWLGSCAAADSSGELIYVAGSTRKVCQLTGDFDRTRGVPTLSRTGERFGVAATDLGSSFEHRGKLFFLFGDTWGRPGDRDGLAWTESRDPAQIRLDFPLDRDGKWLPPTVPGIDQGAFDVPSGGVSVGGKMYVVFTTDWQPQTHLMGRSILAVSEDDGRSFHALYELSRRQFINVSFWSSPDGWLYIFGSGLYRKSSPCLARIRPSELPQRSRLRYFQGVDSHGQPQWSALEANAAPLFRHDVLGEFSVAYCPSVERYVLLYNAAAPRGITMRSAQSPWGPWSDGSVVFDPWRDGGYGHFLHIPSKAGSAARDDFSDPGREAEWGGEYGPYIMARYTTGPKGQCRLFYTLSTWNPYQVIIMQTDLKLVPASETPLAPPKTHLPPVLGEPEKM